MVSTAVLYVGKGRSKVTIEVQEEWEGEDLSGPRDMFDCLDRLDRKVRPYILGEFHKVSEYIVIVTNDRILRPKIEVILDAKYYKFDDCITIYGKTMAEVIAILAEKL